METEPSRSNANTGSYFAFEESGIFPTLVTETLQFSQKTDGFLYEIAEDLCSQFHTGIISET